MKTLEDLQVWVVTLVFGGFQTFRPMVNPVFGVFGKILQSRTFLLDYIDSFVDVVKLHLHCKKKIFSA